MWNFLQDLRSWSYWRALFPHSVRCELTRSWSCAISDRAFVASVLTNRRDRDLTTA